LTHSKCSYLGYIYLR